MISLTDSPRRARAAAPIWHRPTPWPKPVPAKTNESRVLRDGELRALHGAVAKRVGSMIARRSSPANGPVGVRPRRATVAARPLASRVTMSMPSSRLPTRLLRSRVQRVAQLGRTATATRQLPVREGRQRRRGRFADTARPGRPRRHRRWSSRRRSRHGRAPRPARRANSTTSRAVFETASRGDRARSATS